MVLARQQIWQPLAGSKSEVSMYEGGGNNGDGPPLCFCGTLNLLSHFKSKLRESLNGNLFARVQRAEDLLDGDPDLLHQVETALVQQPPAQTEVSPIRLEIISVGLIEVVVVIVLQIYAGLLVRWRWCSERHDRGEVVAAAKEVELDACEECKERQGVQEREGACYRWSR